MYSTLDHPRRMYNQFDYDFTFDNFGQLERFSGTHPAVMQERIAQQNWQLDFDLTKTTYSKKNKLLNKVEKWTGIRG